jgi:hypothetical protein
LFADGKCGHGKPGICTVPTPSSDCGSGTPMCTCDGTYAPHACGSAVDFKNYSDSTQCFPTCGAGGPMCDQDTQVCVNHDLAQSCSDLPAACLAPTADCSCFSQADLDKIGPGCTCSGNAKSFTLQCEM